MLFYLLYFFIGKLLTERICSYQVLKCYMFLTLKIYLFLHVFIIIYCYQTPIIILEQQKFTNSMHKNSKFMKSQISKSNHNNILKINNFQTLTNASNFNTTELNFIECVKSKNANLDLYQISKIINGQPLNINQLKEKQQQLKLLLNQRKELNNQIQMESEHNNVSKQQFSFNKQPKQLIKEADNLQKGFEKTITKETNRLQRDQRAVFQQIIDKYYIIPAQFIYPLRTLVKQFLTFKLAYNQNKNPKRSRTACKTSQKKNKSDILFGKQNICDQKIKKEDLTMNFTFQADFQNLITIKNKRIVQLESQIRLFSQKLNQKNQVIKMMQDRQIKFKNKYKEQFQKLSKDKNKFDFRIFKQQKQNKLIQSSILSKIHSTQKLNSFFHINGSKINANIQETDTKKAFLKQNCNQKPHLKHQMQLKAENNKRFSLRISQQIQRIKSQIYQLQRQRELTLDKLTQNAANMQKYIQEIEKQLNEKKNILTKYQQQEKLDLNKDNKIEI